MYLRAKMLKNAIIVLACKQEDSFFLDREKIERVKLKVKTIYDNFVKLHVTAHVPTRFQPKTNHYKRESQLAKPVR